MSNDARMDRVEAWLRAKNPELIDIPGDLDLIENRIIDSLDFMEFIFLIEELTGRANLTNGLSVDSLRSLRSIQASFFS